MRSYKLDEFVAHSGTVNCLRIGRNTAGVLATGGEDKKVNLWRIGQPHVAKSLSGLQSPVECVTFDSGENQVAAGGANGTIKIWDLESGKVHRSLTGHRSNCLTVEFHPFAPFLATGSLDTNVKVWDLRRKDAITTFKGHTKGVKKLAISPDGKWVCSGSENGEIKLWDMQTGRVVKDNWCHDNSITGIEFHPFEFILATSSTDRTVKVWDLEVWEQVESLGPEATAVKAIAYHRDGKQLLTATSDALKVWGCEPAIHHDTVPMDWRQLADMHLSYKDDQPRVVGCCCSMSAVGVFLVDLRKVMPFAQSSIAAAAAEQAVGTGSGGGRPVLQQMPSYQPSPMHQQQQRPTQQHNGIGRFQQPPASSSSTSSHHHADSGDALRPSSNGGSHYVTPYYSSGGGSSACSAPEAEAPAAAPAAGPLMRQLSRQRTPPGLPTSHSLTAASTDKASIPKQKGSSAGGEPPLAQQLQPGQLQPADAPALQQQQHARRKTGDHFPEFEIRVPAGPPPPRQQQEESGPSRSSSSSRGFGAAVNITATSSNSSSRRESGYDADAAAAAVRGLGLEATLQPAYSSNSQHHQQSFSSNSKPGISSRAPSAPVSPRDRHAGMGSASSLAPRDWQPAAGKGAAAPGDAASRADNGMAAAGDPIVAAMAQRPLLKADLARMVAALQLAKGFVARSNLEGAYKAVLSQGDAAVACMLIEAVQVRQDAFELGSVEPLLKLLELLLASGNEQQLGVGLSALSLVLRGPGQVVREVCNGPGPVGVDLSYEQRKDKCLLVKMALEGLGMKVGVVARGSSPLATRAQLVADELKHVVA